MIRSLQDFGCVAWIALSLTFWLPVGQIQADELAREAEESFYRTGAIIVSGQIEGQDVFCIADTGATLNFVMTGPELRLPASTAIATKSIQTSSGVEQMVIYENVHMGIDGYPAIASPAVQHDGSLVRQALGRNIGGWLGFDVLRHFTLAVENGRPTFTADACTPPANSKTWRIGLNHGHCPVVPVLLPLVGTRDLMLDTGCTECIGIKEQLADAMVKSGDARVVGTTKILDVSGINSASVLVIRELQIFGIQFRNVPAEISEFNVVGLGLLRHVDFVADFPSQTAWVTRVPEHQLEIFPMDASGLRVVWDTRGFCRVRRIEENTTAVGSGIQIDDEIMEISGKQASDLSYWQIRELLSEADTTVHLALKRDGKPIEVDLPLRRDFVYPPIWKSRTVEAEDFFNSLNEGPTP